MIGMFGGIRAILFDAVGTLIYADPPVAEVYQRYGQRYGSRQTLSEIAQRFDEVFARSELRGMAEARPAASADQTVLRHLRRPPTDEAKERDRWKQIVAEVFRDVPAAAGPLLAALWSHFGASDSWRVYDDVHEAWRILRRRPLEVAIASNFDNRLVRICRGLPVLSECRDLFWSADVGFSKPDPRFFATVQCRLGLSPSRILLVGDRLTNDYRGACAAGWHGLLLDRRGLVDGDDRELPPGHVIRSLDQLAPLLDG